MSLPGFALNKASFRETYERLLVGPLFRPWAERMPVVCVGPKG